MEQSANVSRQVETGLVAAQQHHLAAARGVAPGKQAIDRFEGDMNFQSQPLKSTPNCS
jgi:hypothetical protein